MARWVNSNGDTIETTGTTYVVTEKGISRNSDISKWSSNAEQWIENDIKAGYYQGFKKLEVK